MEKSAILSDLQLIYYFYYILLHLDTVQYIRKLKKTKALLHYCYYYMLLLLCYISKYHYAYMRKNSVIKYFWVKVNTLAGILKNTYVWCL